MRSNDTVRPAFTLLILAIGICTTSCLSAQAGEPEESRLRARALGIVVGSYNPGPLNAITDVPGVTVGQTTRISGDGPLKPGVGPIRTGVTVVIPREDVWHKKVPAGSFVLNGTGEMTGLAWISESGFL
jgi:D-aminopeptidase